MFISVKEGTDDVFRKGFEAHFLEIVLRGRNYDIGLLLF